MTYTIKNIRHLSKQDNPVIYRYAFNGSKWRRFELMREISVEINGVILTVPQGFLWDLSSVPAFFWFVLKPFGRFDFAYMLHDIAYQHKGKLDGLTLSRKQCDDLMLQWALELAGTDKVSLRTIDCYIRYYAVLTFGWYVWNKKIKE